MSSFMILLKRHWISIPLCLVILYLCFMDTQSLPEVGMTNFDKLVHFGMFMAVSLIVYFENSEYFRKSVSISNIIYYSFLFPTIYSGLIEIGQEYLSPTRTGDWMDFLWDCVGAALGLVVCLIINKRLPLFNRWKSE